MAVGACETVSSFHRSGIVYDWEGMEKNSASRNSRRNARLRMCNVLGTDRRTN